MKPFIIIFCFFSFICAQITSPCEDKKFIKISEKFIDQMTDEEYEYFISKENECLEYQNKSDASNVNIENDLKIRDSIVQPNPCEDEQFIKISAKYVDMMTEREYQYFLVKQKECAVFDQDNPLLKQLRKRPSKVEKVNLIENLSFIYQPSNLLGIVFLLVIFSII